MTVVSTKRDPAARTLAITAELAAPVERVWELWADPRQLERWWGPPGFPATFHRHDLSPGGRCAYFMTSPEGERFHGLWRVVAVDRPRRIELEDAFADESGAANPDLPVTTMVAELTDIGDGRTRMTITSTFASVEQMEQVLAMGAEEGMTLALGQIDALLAA